MKLSFAVLVCWLFQVLPAQGQDFAWAARVGGTGEDRGYGVAVDSSGNVYTTGYFVGTVDFDPGAGVFEMSSATESTFAVFVSKLDSAGNFLWARKLGRASGGTHTAGVAVDSGGNVYTTGVFTGISDFDPSAGVFNLTSAGSFDIFVSKLDSAGNFLWARQLGGMGGDWGVGVAVDGSGNIYTAGYFSGTADFDPGVGVFTLTAPGNEDIFVSKLDSAGNFLWARQLGGTGTDWGNGVAVDGDGNVYATGFFSGTADFDPGAGVFNLTSAGLRDIFVSKLDSAGNFTWAKHLGGTGDDIGNGITVDGGGNIYTTGYFGGIFVIGTADFDPGAGIFELTSAGSQDAFVSKLDSAGNLVWAKQIGGTGLDVGNGVAVDSSGNVYTTGFFEATADFDPSVGVFNLTSANGPIFVSKLDSAGNFTWAEQTGGGTGSGQGSSLAVDASGNAFTTGRFRSTGDFDPGAGVFNLTSAGASDVFVAKYQTDTGGATPSISEGGIVLATLLPKVNTISPLSIISVFGQNFSAETLLFPNLTSQGKLATTLGGTCLMMNGEALPIFAITPSQINAQASSAKTRGPSSFTVITNCGTAEALGSNAITATVEEATPGFFLFPPLAESGLIAARFNANAVAVAPDGMFSDEFGISRPAKPGDIIVLYGTGWGETTASLDTGELAAAAAELLPEANPMVMFGGMVLAPEDVFYVGVTPQTAGLFQLAIRVPATATAGNNEVVLTVYGKSTPVGPFIPVVSP